MSTHWKEIRKNNFTKWQELADYLQLNEAQRDLLLKKAFFPLNLPRRLADKIEKGSLSDPIFLQFVPLARELENPPAFVEDPTHEKSFCKTSKLLQKYAGRALIIASNACAMHCRFCFRKNFPYSHDSKIFEDEISLLKSDSSLHEVILSGGDPLSMQDAALENLLGQLNRIEHVKLIRFHTRFPIGIPERIDSGFINALTTCSKQIIFVLHVNHPKELDANLFSHLEKLKKLGVVLLSQTVLLKEVNDDVETLKDLFWALVSHGVMPYYLHDLDLIDGGAEFKVDEEKGLRLVEQLRKSLPGYAVPLYVKEVPFKENKTPIFGISHPLQNLQA